MHGHESELEAASEEAEHEQNVAAMAECFRESLARRLRGLRYRRACPAGALGVANAIANGRINIVTPAKIVDRCLPAKFVHQRDADRRIEKLAKRTGGRARTERK